MSRRCRTGVRTAPPPSAFLLAGSTPWAGRAAELRHRGATRVTKATYRVTVATYPLTVATYPVAVPAVAGP
jgi:hypothetical protein